MKKIEKGSKKERKKEKGKTKHEAFGSIYFTFVLGSFFLSCCPRSVDTLRTNNSDMCFGNLFNFAILLRYLLTLATY
jgi:hypothetical protein